MDPTTTSGDGVDSITYATNGVDPTIRGWRWCGSSNTCYYGVDP